MKLPPENIEGKLNVWQDENSTEKIQEELKNKP